VKSCTYRFLSLARATRRLHVDDPPPPILIVPDGRCVCGEAKGEVGLASARAVGEEREEGPVVVVEVEVEVEVEVGVGVGQEAVGPERRCRSASSTARRAYIHHANAPRLRRSSCGGRREGGVGEEGDDRGRKGASHCGMKTPWVKMCTPIDVSCVDNTVQIT
jgi:hypothetical protein